MEKLYDRIDFHNDTVPALNESNLNAISKAIDDIDDRVIKIADSSGGGGEGGSSVEWNQLKKDGEKIAEITIDGKKQNVFASEGGGASTWSEVAEKPFSSIGSGLTVENDVLKAIGGGSSVPWTYIKELDLSGNAAVSIPEFDNYDEFYIHSDTDFDILNQYFIKDVTQRINVGAFSSTTYYCLVLGTIDWNNKTIKKDAYAHAGWSTSCKFKLYGRKLTSSGGSGSDVVELTKAEYDALPDSKLTDGKQYFIKDYSESGSGSENVYSDEEIEIGTWFGKPLYRKVVSKENLALPSYSASSIDVNLTSDIGTSNIQIIKANITVNDSASGQWASVGCQIAHTSGTNSYKVKCLDSWGGASGRYVYFILEYTKD